MKRLWWASFLTLLVLLVTVRPVGALDASPSAILSSPDRFDGKSVTMYGSITNLHETVSHRGRRRPEACGKSKQHFPVVAIGQTIRPTIHVSLVRRNDHAEWDADRVGSSVKFGAPPGHYGPSRP